MSKATVLEAIGSGLYALRLNYDTTNLDAQIEAIEQQLIDAQQPILDAQVALIDLENERDSLASDLDSAITTYTIAVQNDPATADVSPVIAATKALAAKVTEVDVARLRLQRLQSQRLSLAARKTTLENNSGAQQPDQGLQIWCADYTLALDAGAVVPVAIVPGELSGATITMLPQQHPDGWGDLWDREEFGQLVPRLSMTPEATLYNWAMLPGWQRWMPNFRIGTIESLNEAINRCTVLLEHWRSSVEIYPYSNGLRTNLAESTDTRLTNVPIRYMTCDAAAFEVGDRVMVRFMGVDKDAPETNWDSPEVVGFVTNPRQCPGGDPDPVDPVEWIQIQVLDSSDGSLTYYKARRNDADTGWVVELNDVGVQGNSVFRDATAAHVYTWNVVTGSSNPSFSYWYNGVLAAAPVRVGAVARQASGDNPAVVVGYRWTSLPTGGSLLVYAARIGVGQININGGATHTFTGTATNIAGVHPRIVVTPNADGTSFVIDSAGFDAYMLVSIPVSTDSATLSEVAKSPVENCTDNSSCINSGPGYTYSPDITGETNQDLYFYPAGSNTLQQIDWIRDYEYVGSVTASSGTINDDHSGAYTDNYNSFSYSRDGIIDNGAGTQSSTFTGSQIDGAILLKPGSDFALFNINQGEWTARYQGTEIDSYAETGSGRGSGSSGTPYGSTFNCANALECDDIEPSLFDVGGPGGFHVLATGQWLFIHNTNSVFLNPDTPGRRLQFAISSDGAIDLNTFLPSGYTLGQHQVNVIGIYRGAK